MTGDVMSTSCRASAPLQEHLQNQTCWFMRKPSCRLLDKLQTGLQVNTGSGAAGALCSSGHLRVRYPPARGVRQLLRLPGKLPEAQERHGDSGSGTGHLQHEGRDHPRAHPRCHRAAAHAQLLQACHQVTIPTPVTASSICAHTLDLRQVSVLEL